MDLPSSSTVTTTIVRDGPAAFSPAHFSLPSESRWRDPPAHRAQRSSVHGFHSSRVTIVQRFAGISSDSVRPHRSELSLARRVDKRSATAAGCSATAALVSPWSCPLRRSATSDPAPDARRFPRAVARLGSAYGPLPAVLFVHVSQRRLAPDNAPSL